MMDPHVYRQFFEALGQIVNEPSVPLWRKQEGLKDHMGDRDERNLAELIPWFFTR